MNARLAELVRAARNLTRPVSLPSPDQSSGPPSRDVPETPHATGTPHADAIAEFQRRFGFLQSLARQSRDPSKPPLISEKKGESQVELRWLAGGPGVHYVVAIDARPLPPDGKRQPLAEWLWPADHLPPTDIIYDCTDEVLHGKAKPILCDLSALPVRVFAITPTQVERLRVSAIQRITPAGSLAFITECQDAGGRILKGILPVEWSLKEAGKPEPFAALHATTNAAGYLEQSVVALRLTDGMQLVLSVRSQLNGLTAELPIRVDVAAPAAAAAAGMTQELTDEKLATNWNPRPYRWPTAESPARPATPTRK